MRNLERLADYDNALVAGTALRVTRGEETVPEKLEKIFYYVRDEIRFGFPEHGDFMKASETIRLGCGQANTKATLFLALCKAAGIPARIHFATAHRELYRGIITGYAYESLPDFISHSWVEVEIDGGWMRFDSYVMDDAYLRAAVAEMAEREWRIGYGLAPVGRSFSNSFDAGKESFIQMGAVVSDHGAWDDPFGYYFMGQYRNQSGSLKGLVYRLTTPGINRRIDAMRKAYRTTARQLQDNTAEDNLRSHMQKGAVQA